MDPSLPCTAPLGGPNFGLPQAGALPGATRVAITGVLRRAWRVADSSHVGVISASPRPPTHWLASSGSRILVGVTGAHSAALADALTAQGARVTPVHGAWGRPLDPSHVRAAAAGRRHDALVLSAGDRSTGVRTDIRPLRAVASEYGALLAVDYSLVAGAATLDLGRDQPDLAWADPQWSLGLSATPWPVAMSERARQLLSLPTLPTDAPEALASALRAPTGERLLHARALWAGLEAAGLRLPVHAEHRLPVLTLVAAPDGLAERVRQRLSEVYRLRIAAGDAVFTERAWRIGLFSDAAQRQHVTLLLAALASTLRFVGHPVPHDPVAAADAVWDGASL